MADKLADERHHMAETLYDMYRRAAETSGEKPLGKDELAGA